MRKTKKPKRTKKYFSKKSEISKHKKRKKIISKILRFHAVFLIFIFIFYSTVAFSFDPGFLTRDAAKKYAKAQEVAVSVIVPDKPGKPTVAANTNCANNSPYVSLDWNDTTETYNYDISRNGAILATGILPSGYYDSNVAGLTNYSYVITANGSMGSTLSDPLSIQTNDCSAIATATCDIRTIEDENFEDGKTPETENHTPEITGTTNIANATISISITGEMTVSAATHANVNGYWSWTSPSSLDHGSYTLAVIATDPNNNSSYGTAEVGFRIIEKNDSGNKKEKESKKEVIVMPSPSRPFPPILTPTIPSEKPAVPFSISIMVKNKDKIVVPGYDIEAEVEIIPKNSFSKEIRVKYEIIDSKGKTIESIDDAIKLQGETQFIKKIPFPKLVSSGKYRLRATISDEKFIATAEDFFEVQEKTLIGLGTGLTLTQLMDTLGWLMILLLILFLIFAIMLAIEHHLSEKALRKIDEYILQKEQYF